MLYLEYIKKNNNKQLNTYSNIIIIFLWINIIMKQTENKIQV